METRRILGFPVYAGTMLFFGAADNIPKFQFESVDEILTETFRSTKVRLSGTKPGVRLGSFREQRLVIEHRSRPKKKF